MANVKDFPSLRQVFLRLVLFRLYLPLMVLGVTVITGVSYLGEKNLEIQQYQIAQSMAQIVDHHLDQGGRILDAVARVAEISGTEDLSNYMKSTWEAYGYFDTLYYLDEGNKVKLLMPSDPRYLGLDMSNLPDFQQKGKKESLIISRPFISLRTGEPTVYLVRPLPRGDCVVGELNLGLFQQEITNIAGGSGKDFVYIMDQSGTLLAHPSSDLVKQRNNLSSLEIFRRGLAGKANVVYLYEGTRVLGSAARIERTGWIVVDQVPLSLFFSSYAWTLGLIFLVSLAIWLILVWNLRKQLQQYVITPLEQLSLGTNALKVGDFSQVNTLSYIPTAFAELNKLAADFQFMSNNLRVREAALKQINETLSAIPDMLFRVNTEGYLLDYRVQNRYLTCLGLEKTKKSTIFEVFPQELAQHIQDLISIAISTDNLQFSRYAGHLNENVCTLDIRVAAINKQDALLIIQDTTELHKTRQELQRLENLNLIGEMAASIGHEVRNPLTTVRGFLQLFSKKQRFQSDVEILNVMISELDRANAIISEFLALAKNKAIYLKEKSLNEIIEAIYPLLQANAIADNGSIYLELDKDIPSLCLDESEIRQLIINLVRNGLEAMPFGGTLTIKTYMNGKDVVLAVQDHGNGIPQEIVDKIGTPFFTTKEKGTGLGVSVCYSIAARHKAAIEFTTGKNGTEFLVKFREDPGKDAGAALMAPS